MRLFNVATNKQMHHLRKQAGPTCKNRFIEEDGFYYKYAIVDKPLLGAWDGVLKSGGTHFDKLASLPKFPDIQLPKNEISLITIQCNGVISIMENSPLAIRIHLPQKQELLQFITEKYISEMKSWVKTGENIEDSFLRTQAF